MSDRIVDERLPRSELEALQLNRLRAMVRRVVDAVPLYRERFRERGVDPASIRSLADLQRLPFTTKDDFREAYPFGMLAVPLRDVVRVHASSGTTGKPTVVAYTQRDLDLWAGLMARTFRTGGVGPDDIVHNALGYGLFTGGLGFHYGAERIGAAVVPIATGFTDRQLLALRDFGATVLCSTPSYSLHLAEAMAAAGLTPRDLKLRVGFFGAEPWTEAMRQAIESRLGLTAFNVYGLSEVMGPGVAVDCQARRGMHVFEDHFLIEVIDPVTLEPVPPGTQGEIVLTTVTKEALPVVRYRTRDLTTIHPEPCPCGSPFARIGWITGRTDDMFIIRGVNVFPSQIEHALLQVPRVEPHYVLVVRREHALDTLEVRVEAPADVSARGEAAMRALAGEVRRQIYDLIGINADVTVEPPGRIERSAGKAKRVLDLR